MIIFAYLPYGLAEGIKLSGTCTYTGTYSHACQPSMFLSFTSQDVFNGMFPFNRNYVYPVCWNCDVSLHPSQLVSRHSDPHAADIAHSGLHVWSVIFFFVLPLSSSFSFHSNFSIPISLSLSRNMCVCLPRSLHLQLPSQI